MVRKENQRIGRGGRVRTSGRVSRHSHGQFSVRALSILLSAVVLFVPVHALCQQTTMRVAQGQSDRRIPEHIVAGVVSLQGTVRDQDGRAVPGVDVQLRDVHRIIGVTTDSEGIFRLRDLTQGVYELWVTGGRIETLVMPGVTLEQSGIKTMD